MSSSFSRAAFRREMEANLGPSPNDPNRCITDCKVWPKGVEPPDCYCQIRCVPIISRDYETFGQRYWCCKNIEEVQKKVQHHMYRLICKYAFIIFINFELFLVCKSTLVMTRILIGVISMSGLTRGSLIVISNI